ncbi:MULTISPECIES: protein kinase domain-containing protein [unclassified Streptomyces]|uniref:serine/threonine-protein kinase n=1 Tax=unclassified Streptomyces TaxID=2593676 RepID=UPI0033A70444
MFSPLTHNDPARIGTYRLIARLGSGGMGTVYLARSDDGRTVALKTMHARIAADTAFRSRFRLEVDAARVIGGRYGAQVLDADPLTETPWLATEYVLGPPLDDAVSLCGPLPERAVRALGAGLCGALGQLHRSDVVHRDLKPSNIMLTPDGPKVIDFGIARALGDDRLTRTGAAAGTPAFMSPEQATGQEHTPAGDVFALAGVLTYAATGRGAFGTGQAADLLYRVRYAEADLSGVPAGLAPILAHCLSKNPADRPTTAELADRLGSFDGDFAACLPEPLLADAARRATEVWRAGHQRLPAPPDHALEGTLPDVTPARGMSRRKVLTVGGGSVLGVAGAGVGAWAWLGRNNKDVPAGAKAPSALWSSSQVTAEPYRPPFVVGSTLALTSGNEGHGLDTRTGRPAWTVKDLGGPWRLSSDGEKLYAMPLSPGKDQPLTLGTVDLRSGTLDRPFARLTKWDGSLKGSQLLGVAGGLAFVAAGRPPNKSEREYLEQSDRIWGVSAIGLDDGKERWTIIVTRFDAEAEMYPVAHADSRTLIWCEKLNSARHLIAMDVTTGRQLWSAEVDADALHPAQTSLAVDGQHVYLGSDVLSALGLWDGEVAWKYRGPTAGSYGAPTVQAGVVYVVEGAESRALIAVDSTSGKLLWREKNPRPGDPDPGVAPVIGKKYAYKRAGEGVTAVDLRTHRSVWTYRTDATSLVALPAEGRILAVGDRSVDALPLA